jgi:hypothetical protein
MKKSDDNIGKKFIIAILCLFFKRDIKGDVGSITICGNAIVT